MIKVRTLLTVFVLGIAAVPFHAVAQTAVRSHVERFSTPEAQAETLEREANVKLKANPNDAGALNSRALARMRLGRYAEALEDVSRAARAEPKQAEYHATRGFALWKLGRLDEAVAAERLALALDADNFTANAQLGRFLLMGGNEQQLKESIVFLRRAVQIAPQRHEVRFDLLNAYRALGDAAQANAQLVLLQQARPSDPRITYTEALLAADRNDFEDAVTLFRRALALDADFTSAKQDLGLGLIKLARWSEAAEILSALAKAQPDSAEAAYLHALALYNAGRGDEAEHEARRVLRINAGAAEAHTLLGIILASRRGANMAANAEAAESLSQAVALNPNSFDANFYLGRVQYAMQGYAAAITNLKRAVALNERHAEARFFLGTAFEKAGDSDAALVEYERLVTLDPNSGIGLTGRGALLVKQGKFDEAIVALRRAVALDAKNFESHFALGRALALSERYADSVAALQQAVALLPERADARYQLGLSLRRLGRSAEAAREFETVNRLNAEFRSRAFGM
ncbi:MAG: tetratricopeptide repeat protein [Pyrinomonadaceae bacterium MAG19_C2-C3]|nr:tetratricopeptide repeat protein [Pyrinomonadaceae bacterium MAG19_C2-C3]